MTTPVLSNALIKSKLADGKVSVPSYDRSKLKAGVLHIGVGNFHRSHMATYFDDLFTNDLENNLEWGIVGGGMLHFDADKRKLLEPQDWLQTLVEKDATSTKPKVIGSMIDFLPVEEDGSGILKAMKDPATKIVSLTVTEGGYFLSDGKFDANHPQIQKDAKDPENPKTVFGIIYKALKHRKENNITPFTVMSCDNIPHNGSIVKSVCVGLASLIDKEMATWMEEKVAFPNSMVDRITPATTPDQCKFIIDEYGYEDKSPIFCEPFRQWVLEDKFSNGRPNLDTLENVKFVDDVSPYEFMKIRILNGGHAALCYPSALLGLKYVHNAMEHPVVGPFLNTLEHKEIIPTVGPVPDTNLHEYWDIIKSRFSNPTLNDTIGRICYDGASRQPKFIIPVIADNLTAGRSMDGLALVSAMWCKYCIGLTEAGEITHPNDPIWDRLQKTAIQAKTDPKCWIDMIDIYGAHVGQDSLFVPTFIKAINLINSQGVEVAMKEYIAKHASS